VLVGDKSARDFRKGRVDRTAQESPNKEVRIALPYAQPEALVRVQSAHPNNRIPSFPLSAERQDPWASV
jgi:hypothetical protein